MYESVSGLTRWMGCARRIVPHASSVAPGCRGSRATNAPLQAAVRRLVSDGSHIVTVRPCDPSSRRDPRRASQPAVHRAGAALAVDRRSSTPAWTRRPRGLPRRRGLGTARANRPSGPLPQTTEMPKGEARAVAARLRVAGVNPRTRSHRSSPTMRRRARREGRRSTSAPRRPAQASDVWCRASPDHRTTSRAAGAVPGPGACSGWPVWIRERPAITRPSPESRPVTCPPRGRPRAGDLSRAGEVRGSR